MLHILRPNDVVLPVWMQLGCTESTKNVLPQK
jgi:hypothetical protein